MFEVRTYGLEGMSRTKKAALAVGLVATGALLLTVGLVLLLGIAVVGTVGAIAVLGYRRLTGRPLFTPPRLDRYGAVRIVEHGGTFAEPNPDDPNGRVRAGDDDFLLALPEAERPDDDASTDR